MLSIYIEEHFVEGEPELEPPEELAIGEFDEEAQLEAGLDNEDVLEQDVEESLLEETLENLVGGESDNDETEAARGIDTSALIDADSLDELDLDDLEDFEESLDRILERRTASDHEESDQNERLEAPASAGSIGPVQATEFVCRSCFLVRSDVLLADAATRTCRDCAF